MGWVKDIKFFEKQIYSQSGEDGIIEFIFNNIPIINKTSVEFGETGKGRKSNTYYLYDKCGWNSFFFCDKPLRPVSKKAFITAENINDVFKKYKIPKFFDLLSIDIDGNDYWVWKALNNDLFLPFVVIIEFNSNIKVEECKTIKYNPRHKYDKTTYYGASISALEKLGKSKGYKLVYSAGCLNLFFILESLIPNEDIEINDIFSYPVDVDGFCKKWNICLPSWHGNYCDKNRKWIYV